MTTVDKITSDYITLTLDNQSPFTSEYKECIDAVKNLLELSEPCCYNYQELGMRYADHFMCNVRIKRSIQPYSDDWYSAFELLSAIDEYSVVREAILTALIDIKNSEIIDYNGNYRLVRYAVIYGD